MSATFVPGYDDYFMPEVVAPAPQRVMHEVDRHMTEGLQRMELEAREAADPKQAVLGHPHDDLVQYRQSLYIRAEAAATKERQESLAKMPAEMRSVSHNYTDSDHLPSFSPFPKVKGEHVPLSAEENGDILWGAREHVLHSNNVNMQLAWARDVLTWVKNDEDAQDREWRRNGTKPQGSSRPSTPNRPHLLRKDAIVIVQHLVGQNHPQALFMMGKWHEFGKFGYRRDKNAAYKTYKDAAANTCGRAEYRLGIFFEGTNDVDRAVQHYKRGSDLGDSAANYRLGMSYLLGQLGFRRDVTIGLELISKAADTADEEAPQGAFVFGMLVARELPDIDIPETLLPCEVIVAKQYVEKAAYLGFAKAQLKMGQAYELSQLGCEFSPAYSLHYYALAAHQGQAEAALGVSRWFLFGFEGAFPKNEVLAYKYAQQAADAGLATGEFAMGYYYEIGIHVEKELQVARRWYQVATEHGNAEAKQRLEELSRSKTLTKKDHETTTLTRIKSQHGSQRGKRPDRFTPQNEAMPSCSEDSMLALPQEMVPCPAKHSYGPPSSSYGAPANSSLSPTSASATPYPEDDRPAPLNCIRPNAAAPYPEDDVAGRLSQLSLRHNTAARLVADKAASAFGVRPTSPNAGSLQPNPSRYWQPSPGPARQGYSFRKPTPKQFPGPSPIPPAGQYPPTSGSGYRQPSPGAHPGHDYGSRSSSRPTYEQYDAGRLPATATGRVPFAAHPNDYHRMSSIPPAAAGGRFSSAVSRPTRNPRPTLMDNSGGRASAPPMTHQPRPPKVPSPSPSCAPSVASTTNLPGHRKKQSDHPDGKTMGNGPATFEEMGIPQGKNDSDCVIM